MPTQGIITAIDIGIGIMFVVLIMIALAPPMYGKGHRLYRGRTRRRRWF